MVLNGLQSLVAAEIALVVTKALPALIIRFDFVVIVVIVVIVVPVNVFVLLRGPPGGRSRTADVLGRRPRDRLDVAKVQEAVRAKDLLDRANTLGRLEAGLSRRPLMLQVGLLVQFEIRRWSRRVGLDGAADEDAAVAMEE